MDITNNNNNCEGISDIFKKISKQLNKKQIAQMIKDAHPLINEDHRTIVGWLKNTKKLEKQTIAEQNAVIDVVLGLARKTAYDMADLPVLINTIENNISNENN